MANARSFRKRSLAMALGLVAACSRDPVGASRVATATVSAPTASSVAEASAMPSRSALSADASPPFHSGEVFTLAIRGGSVVDGTGGPARRADVLVRKNEIAFVGNVDASVSAERVLDATGATVAPGFIDAHAHLDATGDVESALAQGVTLIVVGQDGTSPARDIGAWLTTIDLSHPRIDVATLVGHATLRGEVGGGKLTAAQRDKLGELAARAMADGAFGLSTGLEYDGGKPADLDELVAIATPVGAAGGVVMSHLRSEDDDQLDASIDELLEQCRRAKARAHVSHIKSVLGRGKARAEAILQKLADARAHGLEVTADIYPYTASYTTLGILFPDFARPPHSYRSAESARHDDLASYLRARVEHRNGPEATLFGDGPYAGKTLADVAKASDRPFEDILMELGPSGGEAAYFVMDDALQSRLLEDPFVMIGSDGGGGRHPRAFGSFARVIEEYVDQRKDLTLEEAVRKMTSLPAHVLRLDGRVGCLAAGCVANVVVFAKDEVHTGADYVHPHVLADGMRFVVVEGAVEREGPKPTHARGGRTLRPSSTDASRTSRP